MHGGKWRSVLPLGSGQGRWQLRHREGYEASFTVSPRGQDLLGKVKCVVFYLESVDFSRGRSRAKVRRSNLWSSAEKAH